MSAAPAFSRLVTVTLNPAIDRTLLIPRFTAGAVNRAGPTVEQPGGKGVNAALALAAYGIPVIATGFLGRDNARPFEAAFQRLGVGDAFLRLPAATRTGIKIVDPDFGQTTEINFPGLTPSAADLAALRVELLRLAAESAGWFVLGGSLPPGVPETFYHDMIAELRAHGCRVALDTSGAPLRAGLAAGPDLVKPNLHELAELLGAPLATPAAAVAAARGLLARGVGEVVVSMGAQGACLVTAEHAWCARPPAIEVRSTVGAGDAMVAGLLAGTHAGLDAGARARLATAFSVAVLTHPRGETPTREMLDAIAARVTVEPLPPPAA